MSETSSAACFIIAEAGVNHNGSVDLAKRLIDAAKEAGADAVKFQTFKTDRVVTAEARTVEYQARATAFKTQRDMIRPLELSEGQFTDLAAHCAKVGIEFMSTPFDPDSADFLVRLGMKRIKIASGEVTYYSMLEHVASYRLPLILSTGMCDLPEVRKAVSVIEQVWLRGTNPPRPKDLLTLLHCTSNYPTAPVDLNLRALVTMREATGYATGLSDHSLGIASAFAAVALGATVIEKHFTLDRDFPGPDHQASLDPVELGTLVKGIRTVELALGDGKKVPRASEMAVRDAVRRSIVARTALPAGAVITKDALEFLRPGTGIPAADCERVLGKRVVQPIAAGEIIRWEKLQ